MLFGSARKKHKLLSDAELIQLLRDEACAHTIPILYERYAHLVMGSCVKYLKQVESAEDITLIIFGQLESKLKKHSVEHFKSWLYQVTRNECLQFLRKNKNTRVEWTEAMTALTEDNLELVFEKEIQLSLLEEAIQHLKGDQKTCIELFYLKQKSYNTISEELSIPLNTVKSAIQNGKRSLKIWMEGHEKH